MNKLVAALSAFLWMAAASFAQQPVVTAGQNTANTFTNPNQFVGPFNYYPDTGTANAFVISTGCGPSNPSCPNVLTSLQAGAMFSIKAKNTSTGTSTLAVDNVGAISISNFGTVTAGNIFTVQYDGAHFQVIGSGGSSGGGGGGGGGGVPPAVQSSFIGVGGSQACNPLGSQDALCEGGSQGLGPMASIAGGPMTPIALCPTTIAGCTAGASGGSLALAGNQNALYLSPSCPTPYVSGNCYYTPANTQIVTDVTVTNGSPNVATSSTDPPFVAGDVGKRAQATVGCGHTVANPEKCDNVGCPDTTILTYTDAHHVVLAANCTASTVVQSGVSNRFAWGNPDDTGISSVVAAVKNAGTGAIYLPCSGMWVEQPAFILNPAVNSGLTRGPMSVIGCVGGTTIVPGFNFNYSACTTDEGCIFYDNGGQSCCALNAYSGPMDVFRDIGVNGPTLLRKESF